MEVQLQMPVHGMILPYTSRKQSRQALGHASRCPGGLARAISSSELRIPLNEMKDPLSATSGNPSLNRGLRDCPPHVGDAFGIRPVDSAEI